MALMQAIEVRGVTLPAAYIRVDRITGGKYAGFNAEVGIYASAGVSLPLDNFGLAFTFVSGQDLLETAYFAVKALPNFSSAADC